MLADQEDAVPAPADQTAWFFDSRVAFRATGELFALESSAPRGDSPPLHVHHTEDELFVLLDGAMTLALGGELVSLRAGELLLAPKGVPHTYRVDSESARWLAITTRGDFEGFVHEIARRAEHDGLPQRAAPPTAAEQRALAATAARYGIEFVGAPLSL